MIAGKEDSMGIVDKATGIGGSGKMGAGRSDRTDVGRSGRTGAGKSDRTDVGRSGRTGV